METVLFGTLAVLIGGLLCFRGYLAFRVVIAVWGAFAGFVLGAGLVAGLSGESFLGTLFGWTVAGVLAVLFGLLAYVYYAVSVVIGMGAMGFTLGTTLMVAIGVTWSWLIVLVGLAIGILLAMLAVAADLPLTILAILSAFAGASSVVTGLLLFVGVLDRADLSAPQTTAALELGWWWTALYLALAMFGLVVQLRDADARRGNLRDAWAR